MSDHDHVPPRVSDEDIERVWDHHYPYRPIVDSPVSEAARAVCDRLRYVERRLEVIERGIYSHGRDMRSWVFAENFTYRETLGDAIADAERELEQPNDQA